MDLEHDEECTGWHPTEDGIRHCRVCNRVRLNPYGPPPWHKGDWHIDGVKWRPKASTEVDDAKD